MSQNYYTSLESYISEYPEASKFREILNSNVKLVKFQGFTSSLPGGYYWILGDKNTCIIGNSSGKKVLSKNCNCHNDMVRTIEEICSLSPVTLKSLHVLSKMGFR